ncbi:MAG TPA: hypothetical protein VMH24_00750 [Candidatus Sulfotelmatobacter sp.]|nr:hypothetical protein [Candidatus Sulfotelmatobacter sp.]
MGFEVPPAPVPGSRLRRSSLAVAAALALVVGVALATQVTPESPASTPPPGSPAPTLVAAAPAAADTPGPTPRAAHPMPSQIDCRESAPAVCLELAQAALDVLPPEAPAVLRVTVYRSLLCDNDADCPPVRLVHSGPPSGSVIVDFADGGPQAWIDVVTLGGASAPATTAPGVTAAPATLDAWIIR